MIQSKVRAACTQGQNNNNILYMHQLDLGGSPYAFIAWGRGLLSNSPRSAARRSLVVPPLSSQREAVSQLTVPCDLISNRSCPTTQTHHISHSLWSDKGENRPGAENKLENTIFFIFPFSVNSLPQTSTALGCDCFDTRNISSAAFLGRIVENSCY
jgi:hypothetical protein